MSEPAPSTDKELEITETIVRLCPEPGAIKAFVDIIFNNRFKVYGFTVVMEKDKFQPGRPFLHVRNPNRKDASGKYVDISHPINKDTFNHVVRTILAAYKDAINTSSVAAPAATPAVK